MTGLDTFFREQLEHWPLARDNYHKLKTVQVREMDFDGLTVRAEYNPSRIRSVSANMDKRALESRPCPLCPANHPKEQEILPFDEHFGIAVNPYPVFDRHFTIICNKHIPQLLKGHLSTMLKLAEQLPGYSILYNGALCGASIPDHLHFQAIPKGLLPVEGQWQQFGKLIESNSESHIYNLEHFLRSCYVIESKSKFGVEQVFNETSSPTFLHPSPDLSPQGRREAPSLVERGLGVRSSETNLSGEKAEPMMNIVCRYDRRWRLFIFPRKQHRPAQYYAQGEEQILTSPGVIDMAGVFVLPREEDFNKIDKESIRNIYNQISL